MKLFRIGVVLVFFLSCVSCSIVRRSADKHALSDVFRDTAQTVSVLESRGYSCTQSSFTEYQRRHFQKEGLSPEKLTCHRQVSSILCQESDFIDLFSVEGQVIAGGADTVPICIWH